MMHFYSTINTPGYISIITIGIALCIYGTIRYKGWRWLSSSGILMGIFLIINRLLQDSAKLSALHKPFEETTLIVSVLFLLYILIGCVIVKYKQGKRNPNDRKK